MKPSIAFFGSDQFSILVAEELLQAGFTFTTVITVPDKPQGRKMILTPSPFKVWAQEKNIPVLQPETLDENFAETLRETDANLFIVASYGLIVPKHILDIPRYKTLNVHPSLLPYYRGATPLETAILDDTKHTGVTIMEMDEKMDHGPIVSQIVHNITEWPTKPELLTLLAQQGGEELVHIIPEWIQGTRSTTPQDHSIATFTKKIQKSDGELHLNDDDYTNYRKYLAFQPWPGTFFFKEENGKQVRYKITKARFENGTFVIERVIPEGKKEQEYSPIQ
jgi:methionyl-tRNA formyltransferase